MLRTQLKFIVTIVLVLGMSISLQSLIASWQAPTANPPNNNIKTPINTGLAFQKKFGSFDVGGDIGVGRDLILQNGRMAINTGTSTSRLRLLDNVGGPDIYIEGSGVNPELALGDNSTHWGIYNDTDFFNTDDLRFWWGNNSGVGDDRMVLTNTGTLKIKEICDENGNNCVSVSSLGGGGGVPKRAVVAFNSTTCPTDWQIANGTNGTPDLRGRFIRGLDLGTGRDPGRILNTYQDDELKSHTHGLSAGTVNRASGTGHHGGNVHTSESGLNTTATGGSETRPKNIALVYCVKMIDPAPSAGGPETDPTITDNSIKDGVDWSELSGIPADIADGDDVGNITNYNDLPSGSLAGYCERFNSMATVASRKEPSTGNCTCMSGWTSIQTGYRSVGLATWSWYTCIKN